MKSKFHVNGQDWIPENGGLLVDAGSGAVAGAKAIVPEPLGCCLRCVLGGNVEVPSPLRWAQVTCGIYIHCTKHSNYGMFAYIWLIFMVNAPQNIPYELVVSNVFF